jgi:YVTN family beta-propeller protein
VTRGDVRRSCTSRTKGPAISPRSPASPFRARAGSPTTEDSASITFIDAATARAVATVEVGREPEAVTASPTGEVVAIAARKVVATAERPC